MRKVILLTVAVSLMTSAISAERICRHLGGNLRAVGEDYHIKITYFMDKDLAASYDDCQSRCLARQGCTAAYFKNHGLWYTCWLYNDGNHKPIRVQKDTGFPELTTICCEHLQIFKELTDCSKLI